MELRGFSQHSLRTEKSEWCESRSACGGVNQHTGGALGRQDEKIDSVPCVQFGVWVATCELFFFLCHILFRSVQSFWSWCSVWQELTEEEMIEESNAQVHGPTAPTVVGVGDSQTKARGAGTEIESASSTTKSGSKRKTTRKTRTKATCASWESCHHLACRRRVNGTMTETHESN